VISIAIFKRMPATDSEGVRAVKDIIGGTGAGFVQVRSRPPLASSHPFLPRD
jgi:hypothetical protein